MQPFAALVLLASVHLQDLSSEELYKKALPSIATLAVEKTDGTRAMGTAFLTIKDGLAMTAYHVLRGGKRAAVRFSDGQEFDVSGIVDADSKRDVVLIRVKVAGRPLLSLNLSEPPVGSKVYTLGAPQGMEFSVSDGLVSPPREVDGVRYVQCSCPVSPGNSGGPLLNGKGEVIGIISWQRTDSQNLNFAVPASYGAGLDPTLPTKTLSQWRGSSPSLFAEPIPAMAAFATEIWKIRRLAAESRLAYWDLNRIVTELSPVKVVIPAGVFRAQDDLRQAAKTLRKLEAPSEELAAACQAAAERYEQYADGFDICVDATTYAMQRRWDAYATSLWEKGAAKLFSSAPEPFADSKDTLLAAVPEAEKAQASPELRAYLGDPSKASSMPVTKLLGIELDPRTPSPVVLTVDKTQPAGKAGVKAGDKILSLDGQAVTGWNALEAYWASHAGQTVKVRVRRFTGKEATLSVTAPKA